MIEPTPVPSEFGVTYSNEQPLVRAEFRTVTGIYVQFFDANSARSFAHQLKQCADKAGKGLVKPPSGLVVPGQ